MTITFQSEEMRRTKKLDEAYGSGYRAGRLDRSFGWRSEYAWNCINDEGYPGAFSHGYRDAQNDLPKDSPWSLGH